MRQLPLFAAFKHVWATVFNNAGAAFRISWPWLLVIAILTAFFVASSPTLSGVSASKTSEGRILLLFSLLIVIFLLAFASIAVNWHRFVLLDEMPKGLQVLRIDGQVWRYLGNLFLIGLIVGLPFGISASVLVKLLGNCCLPNPMLGRSMFDPPVIFGMLVFFGLLLALNVIVTRLAIKLPAVALGRRDYGLGQAWNDSAGNFFPIMGYACLIGVSVLAPQKFLEWVSGNMENSLGLLGTIQVVVVSVVVQWVALIVGISALTSLYGFFAERRGL
jgi:hypothetical protein